MNFLMVVCGLIGLARDGLPGLFLGALFGYFLSRVFSPAVVIRGMAGGVDKVQAQFLDSTFAVMGAMCKADGHVSDDEIRVAESLFDRMNLVGTAREAAKRSFNRGKEADFDLDAEVARFVAASGGQRILHQMFIQVQVSAIAADGQMHPAEYAMLMRVGRGLDMSAAELANLEALLRTGGGRSSQRSANDPGLLDDAYRELGVSSGASDAEVKRAYRLLMSQNHPDKLAAKGLPESMRAIAEEKTRKITAAYERIENARRSR